MQGSLLARDYLSPLRLAGIKRRARWIVRGKETDVTISEFGNYWRVHLPGIEDGSRVIPAPAPLR